MQHPEAAALMATIRANKADDLPRLVYADWLEQHDQSERAAFIRGDIAAPGVGPSASQYGMVDWVARVSGTRVEDWRQVLMRQPFWDEMADEPAARSVP